MDQSLQAPRSLPPWIHSYHQGDGSLTSDKLQLLLNKPGPPSTPGRSARSVLHNNPPSELQRRVSRDGYVAWSDPRLDRPSPKPRLTSFLRRGRGAERGRKWDHLRSADPVIVAAYGKKHNEPSSASDWREFLRSSMYGRIPNEESEVVDIEVLNKLQPTFNHQTEALAQPMSLHTSRRRRTKALYERIWHMMIRHILVPLACRLVVMFTSIICLAISATIYRQVDRANRAQAVLAIVVDTLAIPYIGYMVWDEYTGKPLGLRSASQKFWLILLDLVFIIFKSASTAMAFEAVTYSDGGGTWQWPRPLTKVFAAFLFVGLVAWTLTFIVNVFRTVERLAGGDGDR